MKQYQIINAYKATEQLADDKTLSNKSKWSVYLLRKKLSTHMDFQREREDDLRKKYAPYANEQGLLSGEKYQEYIKELDELGEMDVDVEASEPIELDITPDMTVRTFEALDNFVRFVQPD